MNSLELDIISIFNRIANFVSINIEEEDEKFKKDLVDKMIDLVLSHEHNIVFEREVFNILFLLGVKPDDLFNTRPQYVDPKAYKIYFDFRLFQLLSLEIESGCL